MDQVANRSKAVRMGLTRMYLPLRYAVSFPLLAATLIAMFLALLTHRYGRIAGFAENYSVETAGVLAAVASLLLVLPNLTAAAIANRYSNGRVLTFAVVFAVAFVAAWIVQGLTIKRLGAVSWNIFTPLTPWVFAGNILLCWVIAALVGRSA